jgi:hypothetical protein
MGSVRNWKKKSANWGYYQAAGILNPLSTDSPKHQDRLLRHHPLAPVETKWKKMTA